MGMVSAMVRFGFVVGALALVGCAAGGGGEGAEQSENTSFSAAGTTAQASTSESSGENTGSEQQSTQGAPAVQAQAADETETCDIKRRYYDLVAVLTEGPVSCSSGGEYTRLQVQTENEAECRATVCIAGTHCITFECAPGTPVTECVAMQTNGSGCTYEWTLSLQQ